jgi:hypothetical protein
VSVAEEPLTQRHAYFLAYIINWMQFFLRRIAQDFEKDRITWKFRTENRQHETGLPWNWAKYAVVILQPKT